MGKNKPGFAFGADIFMAAGTAMYDALAAKTAKMKRLATSCVTKELSNATIHPFTRGIAAAKMSGNHPCEKKAFSLRPLVIPISNKKMARNPLNKSLVKGLMPSACLALATNPMAKLPV